MQTLPMLLGVIDDTSVNVEQSLHATNQESQDMNNSYKS
jgi:hypothetical protein